MNEPPFEACLGDKPYLFVSYSHRDKEVVYPEIARWHGLGFRTWYDEGIDPGNEWPQEVAHALDRCSLFVVFISPHAVESQNVKNEIHFAINRKKPFLAIHIQETVLPIGLELRMGDIQAILKWRMREDRYYRQMEKALPDELRMTPLLAANPGYSGSSPKAGGAGRRPVETDAPARDRVIVPSHVAPPAVAQPTNLGFERPVIEGMPPGWFNSAGYVQGVSTSYRIEVVSGGGMDGGQCVRMSRADARAKAFGSLMQRCRAERWIGRTIRVEGALKSEGLEQWAGLWLRLDGPAGHLFFDNMHDRPIRGSTPWTHYAIQTRIPDETQWINYGVLLVGNGAVWADEFRLKSRVGNRDWADLDA